MKIAVMNATKVSIDPVDQAAWGEMLPGHGVPVTYAKDWG